MGLPGSGRLPRVRPYSGAERAHSPFAYGTLTLCGRTFQNISAWLARPRARSYNPARSPGRFGLVRFRSPLLTESRFLSLPPGTEMFQFPGLAARAYAFSVSLFGHPGLNARLTAPPGLSQSSTPFIASWRLDIPHTPLVAWPH
jgi:hypothetical protein